MNNEKKRAERIFVSHAFEDREAAWRVARAFARNAAGVSVFTLEVLNMGEDWRAKIREEIIKSDVFIILLSPKTLNSPWVLAEIGAAWALEKPFVIVRTHPAMEVNLLVEVTPEYLVNLEDLDEPDVVQQIIRLNGTPSNAAST